MATSSDRFGDDFGGEKMWGLKELPYPEAIPMAPQTIGWLLLAIFVLALAGWFGWRTYRRWKANAYRRTALARIADMRTDPAHAVDLPFVLRKTALIAFDRKTVASLRGDAWISWLNETASGTAFSDSDAQSLDALAYSKLPVDGQRLSHLLENSRRWVERHHA